MDVGHSVQCSLLRLFLHFRVVFCVCRIQCWVIACLQLQHVKYTVEYKKSISVKYWLNDSFYCWRSRYWLKQTALQPPCHEGSHLSCLNASSELHLALGIYWPPLWHTVVWYWKSHVPCWRDQCMLGAVPAVGANSRLWPIPKMNSWSRLARSGNHWNFDWFAPCSLVTHGVNSHRARMQSISVLRDLFVWVLSQPHC